MKYTAVIRTLGTAGEKYQKLLDSLLSQSIKPEEIIVYIAEGYSLPKETVGIEKYIYVPKGMVAQRALQYTEVKTEYMLFLDDDLFLPVNFVEQMFKNLREYNADVISPDIFPNAQRPFLPRLLMTLSGRMRARKDDGIWGYKVMCNSGYSYNTHPTKSVYLSQTNAGACFLCKKESFLRIHFEEELWLDKMSYALGDDQVLFYKMYLLGLKVLTFYNSGILHLDAGQNLQTKEKEMKRIYCDFRFKTIFWHRFIYLPEKSLLKKFWVVICISYTFIFGLCISLVKCQFDIFKTKKNAIQDGILFFKSTQYRSLPLIK